MLAAKHFEVEARIPKDCEEFTTPGGYYALFQFQGTTKQLLQRGNYALGSWLPRSGYWLGSAPAIAELAMVTQSDLLHVNSWLPLRHRRLKTHDRWWD